MQYEIISDWLARSVIFVAWLYAVAGAIIIAVLPTFPLPMRVGLPLAVVLVLGHDVWKRRKARVTR